MAISHRPARNVRRTSRTALNRCPSAVAIIGEDAVIRPSRNRLKVKVRLSASVAAASWVAPSRPISRTSVAWIACWVRLARISGQASASVARSSSRQAPLRSSGEMFAGRASIDDSAVACDGASVEKVWPSHAAFSASDGANMYRGLDNEVRPRNLEAAGRDQGRARPDLHAVVLRRRSTARLRRGRRRSGDGVLDLNLNGSVVEQPARAQWSDVAGGSAPRAISPARPRRARSTRRKDDDRVKAVALDLDGFTGGGQTAIGDLADAVRRVRAAGKPVVAYGVGYTDDSYQLASAASEIWLNPLGRGADRRPGRIEPLLQGPARQARRDRQRLSRRHLQVGGRAVHPQRHVARGASRITLALDQAELESWRQECQAGAAQGQRRPVPAGHERRGRRRRRRHGQGRARQRASSTGSATAPRSKRGWRSSAAASEQRARRLSAGSSSAPTSPTRSIDKPNGPIGIVTIAGMIVDGKAGPGTAGGDTIAKEIDDGVRDKGIKALVVRVDSPGGSVLASERIRQALLEAKAKKIPVVVSMGSVAASGGYWVSTPADFIYAEPSTITGSIGVFGILPSFQGTLQKLGIGADGVKTTPLSGEPDLFKGPSPEANTLIQTRRQCDVRPLPQHRRRGAAQDAAAGRPDRAGPRVGRRHGAPDRPRRRLRRNDRGDRQGGRAGQARQTSAESATSSRAPSFREQLIETLASRGRRRQRGAGRRLRDAGACSRSSSSPRSLPKCGRSSPVRASRRAASNARRSRRRGSRSAT